MLRGTTRDVFSNLQAFCVCDSTGFSFQGAILGNISIPGKARTKQIRKKFNQPVSATMYPTEEFTKVRGTAIKLVNSANWVAV